MSVNDLFSTADSVTLVASQAASGTTVTGSVLSTSIYDGEISLVATITPLGVAPTFSGFIEASGVSGFVEVSGSTFSNVVSGVAAYDSIAGVASNDGSDIRPVITFGAVPGADVVSVVASAPKKYVTS